MSQQVTRERARSSAKWGASDIPDQHGRTAVITGANSGIGLEAARYLAARGARVVLAMLRAATDPAAAGGDYYGPAGLGEFTGPPRLVRSSARSRDEAAQRRLWAVSEELTGVTFAL